MRRLVGAILVMMSQALFLGCGPGQDTEGSGQDTTGETGVHWSERFGGAADEHSLFAAVDGSGDILLAGSVQGEIDLGGGPLPPVTGAGDAEDVFLARLDSSGKHLWSKRVGDVASQYCLGMALGASGDMVLVVFVLGTADFGGGPIGSPEGQYYVLDLDSSGKQKWARPLDHGYSFLVGELSLDAAGNILMTGKCGDSVDFGGGPLVDSGLGSGGGDVFLVKLDPQGQHLWSKRFGNGEGSDEGEHVAADPAGNVFVSGRAADVIDFGGGPLGTPGVGSGFLAKFGPEGNLVYGKTFGGAGDSLYFDLAADAGGNAVIAGRLGGTVDFGGGPLKSTGPDSLVAAKLDPMGQHLKSKTLTGGGVQAPSIAVSPDGHVLLTGPFDEAIDFGGGKIEVTTSIYHHQDVFFAELDADLGFVSQEAFPDVGQPAADQIGTVIVPMSSNGVLLGGYFAGSVDFGDGPLQSAGQSDLFLVSHPR